MKPIRPHRIKTRSQGGKNLSYVEAWDIKAHLTRIFGFGNWDFVVTDAKHLYQREVKIGSSNNKRDGWEVAFQVLGTLPGPGLLGPTPVRARRSSGRVLLRRHRPRHLYDNAIKAGASDALKRCALAFGSSFGLSLYDDGSRRGGHQADHHHARRMGAGPGHPGAGAGPEGLPRSHRDS